MNSTIIADIEQAHPFTDTILQLILKPKHYIHYEAGQYLNIILEKQSLSYSIANAPLGDHKYELHIRHSAHNLGTQELLSTIKQKGKIDIQLPFGHCHLKNLHPDKPILFIAGGTGFAPIKSMIEQLLATNDSRNFELFWGARSQSDLYMNEEILRWQAHVEHFRYFSLLSNTTNNNLASAVLNHYSDLKQWQIVISGPFDMVYAIRDALVDSGLTQTQLFSDAFTFEHKEST